MPKYIFSSDIHMRGDRPICRTETEEEWLEFQSARLNEVISIANEHKAELILGGDLYDVPNVSSAVVATVIDALLSMKKPCHILAGNHELPYRRFANVGTSSIGILKAIAGDNTGILRFYTPKEQLIEGRFQHSHQEIPDISVVHTLSFPSSDDIPFNAKATTAEELCKEYQTKWVLVGDLHETYHVQIGDQHVFSSGCLTQQTVKERDSNPGVWYIDTDKEEFEFIEVYHDSSKISDEHLLRKRERVAEIESVLEAMKSGKTDVSLDYIKNLYYYVEHNKVSEGAIKIIDEIKEGVE